MRLLISMARCVTIIFGTVDVIHRAIETIHSTDERERYSFYMEIE
jgi:hypothetical protein